MRYQSDDENDAHGPEKWTKTVKKLGVRIDPVLTQKDLQVSDEMPKNVGDPDEPCYADDDFLAD
jgi:hypothetical protein